jgi:hypothetical protein
VRVTDGEARDKYIQDARKHNDEAQNVANEIREGPQADFEAAQTAQSKVQLDRVGLQTRIARISEKNCPPRGVR